MQTEIYPLDRVELDGVGIDLGMEQSAVEAAIGNGERIGMRYYYFNGEMAIDYLESKVDFIEFLSGADGTLRPTVYGVSVFEADASDLFSILKKQDGGTIGDTERGYSYQFRNISIGIYREAVPDEIREMVKEAERFGTPMSEDEIQYEMNRANHRTAVGFGVAGYYRR